MPSTSLPVWSLAALPVLGSRYGLYRQYPDSRDDQKEIPPEISAAVTAASSTIGIIILPVFRMILYAMASETSIGRLFLAGAIIPGVLVGLLMMLVNAYMSAKYGYGREREKMPSSRNGITDRFQRWILALTMPLIIIGGIVGGIVIATEASALAVVYASILAFSYLRNKTRTYLSGHQRDGRFCLTAVVHSTVVSATFLG